ncbi:MAG TPA: hypothetical protein VE616_06940 [Candidatus Udaeobacter sp.]|jgi:hypothetical protein|nr:hypothetical protein [Candidatus Udaeobacter sp.]
MHAKIAFAMLLVLTATTLPAHAFNEPDNFMGVRFDKSVEDSIQKCPDDTFRNYKFNEEHEGKVGRIQLEFNRSRFPVLYAAMEERYGKPTTTEHPVWMSKGGVKLENDVMRWVGNEVTIEARKIGPKMDNSTVDYTTKAFREAQAQRGKKDIQDAAKGL